MIQMYAIRTPQGRILVTTQSINTSFAWRQAAKAEGASQKELKRLGYCCVPNGKCAVNP